MRIVIHLNCKAETSIPINYNYQLSSAIYNLLRFGSPEFSDFLHDKGYRLAGRKYKLFTFALRFEKTAIENNHLVLKSPKATLYITSPMIDPFIKNFIIGTFENKVIQISDKLKVIDFKIISAELIPEPEFTDKMKFLFLSPMVLSTIREYKGKLQQYYLRPDDIDDINRILTKNLLNKKALIQGNQTLNSYCSLKWDEEFLSRNKRVTKKITINEHGRVPVDLIGILAPFTIEGDPELIKIGYECGFGEKNSMGFGLADVVNSH
ncbi:MAG: CRISPR-associated endoribonuclease Cas6 [Ignavibacteriales bacterium UTCHB2]|nr:MAG: CRISPR associated protein Cas6 [Ignavibacteria bacterium ADurb.Bin266]OQY72703.1 MAG: CRISPR-associated endoribonuclease Cas6 [Ignavibacteriales bacterium UTCHB2]HQI41148.1 CRISPR-associated endoribonuclease Cas6 [Ignavibacteriaceae bacterium]